MNGNSKLAQGKGKLYKEQQKRLRKITIDAINEVYRDYNRKLKNPLYRLYIKIKKWFFRKKFNIKDLK